MYNTLNKVKLKIKHFTVILLLLFYSVSPTKTKSIPGDRRKQVPISMAVENGELMQECFHKHLRMGTARMKEDKETEEEDKEKRRKMERSRVDTK